MRMLIKLQGTHIGRAQVPLAEHSCSVIQNCIFFLIKILNNIEYIICLLFKFNDNKLMNFSFDNIILMFVILNYEINI